MAKIPFRRMAARRLVRAELVRRRMAMSNIVMRASAGAPAACFNDFFADCCCNCNGGMGMSGGGWLSLTSCDQCDGGAMPGTLNLTFAGVGESTCGSCTTFNSVTFRLLNNGNCGYICGGTACGPCGSDPNMDLTITQVYGSLLYSLRVIEDGPSAPQDHVVFTFFSPGGDTDCSVARILTYNAQSGPVTCDYTSATATITPV